MSEVTPHTYNSGEKVYDVTILIDLSKSLPAFDLGLAGLAENFNAVCWYTEGVGVDKKLCTPLGILANKDAHPFFKKHYERAMSSDLSFPILVDKDNVIIDGMHRALKAYILKMQSIKAKRFNEIPEQAVI